MTPALLQGRLHFTPPARVSGWCVVVDRPGHRALVDVVVDGVTAASMVAAQRFEGAGDGRHGFAMTLPGGAGVPGGPASGGTRIIEAREHESGQVFARVVLRPYETARRVEARLAQLDTTVLRTPIGFAGPTSDSGLRQAFRGLARALAATRDGGWQTERAALRHSVPRLALSENPMVSLILLAAPAVDSTIERLTALHAICEQAPVELLLADDGADPRTILLPGLLPGLRYTRCAPAGTGSALNMLAAEARAPALCVIDAADAAPGWCWPQLDPGADETVHLGNGAAQAALAGPPPWLPAPRVCGPHGFALHMPRALWIDAGGFDPSMCGDAALADLALKCSLLGAPVIAWREALTPAKC
jgi:hypothetical protein